MQVIFYMGDKKATSCDFFIYIVLIKHQDLKFSVQFRHNKISLNRLWHVHVDRQMKPVFARQVPATAAIHVESGLHQYSDHAVINQKGVPDCGYTRHRHHHEPAVSGNPFDGCDPRFHGLNSPCYRDSELQYNFTVPLKA